jgi:hypothetical protein
MTADAMKDFITIDRTLFNVDVEPYHRQTSTV